MRAAFLLLAAGTLLAACSPGARETAASPPIVSYPVPGNDAAQTNDRAQNYCAQYGHAAQYRGVTSSKGGDLAIYSCDGEPVAPDAATAAPATSSGSTQPPARDAGKPTPLVPCADALHPDRPGGPEYHGPPVAGCPASR